MSLLFSPARPTLEVSAPSAPMVEWELVRSGIWTARIGLDRAGEVRLTPIGYRLLDWDGADLGTWPTLADAQRRLEPEVRAALREAADRGDTPIASVLGTAAASVTAASLLAAVAWFAVQSL